MFSKKLILSALLFVAVLAYGVYAASSGAGSGSESSNISTSTSGPGTSGGADNAPGTGGTETSGASNMDAPEMDTMGISGTSNMGTDTGMTGGTGPDMGTGAQDKTVTQSVESLSSAGFNQRDQVSALLQSRRDSLNLELQQLNSQPQNDETKRQISIKQRQLQALDANIQNVSQADEQDWDKVRDAVLNDDSMR